MNRRLCFGRRITAALVGGAVLLQVGPCTSDALLAQLGVGVRAALNGFFSSVTNQFVTEILGLP